MCNKYFIIIYNNLQVIKISNEEKYKCAVKNLEQI